jgi:hypothetical protein
MGFAGGEIEADFIHRDSGIVTSQRSRAADVGYCQSLRRGEMQADDMLAKSQIFQCGFFPFFWEARGNAQRMLAACTSTQTDLRSRRAGKSLLTKAG